MKPTIGRIVHVTENGNTSAAIITGVHSNEEAVKLNRISVCIFRERMQPGLITGIDFSESPQDGFWSWPPRVG